MPDCKRCGRNRATAELRRSPAGGYICKEAGEVGKHSQCAKIAREQRARDRRERRAPVREASQAIRGAEA